VGIAGKWISLGKAKPGEYPLYGLYYYRWWLAEKFVALVDMVTIADTPLLPAMMRCMGSRVGAHCHIGVTYISAAFDLVSIGDDVTMGKDTVLATSWIERGRLILAPVSVGSQVNLGSQSVLEGGSNIEDGGELGPLSMLPQGAHVPAGERWTGSPARFHAYFSRRWGHASITGRRNAYCCHGDSHGAQLCLHPANYSVCATDS
jgi:non-ribosomal peptide synthetase-like protein